jgi:hypothetical protein
VADDPVQIAEARDAGEAEVIRELLEAEGIQSYYTGGGGFGSLDPVGDHSPRAVFVHASDVEAARAVLADASSGA